MKFSLDVKVDRPFNYCMSQQKLLLNLHREGLIFIENTDNKGGTVYNRYNESHYFYGLRLNPSGFICLYSRIIYPLELSTPSELLKWAMPHDRLEDFYNELEANYLHSTWADTYRVTWNEQLQSEIPEKKNFWHWLILEKQDALSHFLEQWGCMGHPFHPVDRMKFGWSKDQVLKWSPEFEGNVPLVITALHGSEVEGEFEDIEQYKLFFKKSFPDIYRSWITYFFNTLNDGGADYLPFPMHPYQLEALKNEAYSREKWHFHGPFLMTQPSMSLRTMMVGPYEPVIKVPVAIRTTSAKRFLSPRSCYMGPRLSEWVHHYFEEKKDLRTDVLTESYGLYHKSMRARASVVYRCSAKSVCSEDEHPVPVAALMAPDPYGIPLIESIWKSSDESTTHNFKKYCETVIPGLLTLFVETGLALEAHQQNSLVCFNTDGDITKLLIRDFGAPRIWEEDAIFGDFTFCWEGIGELWVSNRDEARTKLIHSLFLSHLNELILLLHERDLLQFDHAWKIVKEIVVRVLNTLREKIGDTVYHQELEGFTQTPFRCKALLSMRLKQTSQYHYKALLNPMKSL